MLKLYDQNKNPLGYIMKYGDDLCIESDLSNGDKSLSFTYLAKNPKDIQNEYYIETKDDRYVVKEVGVSSDGFPEFKCQLDLEDLEADMFESFSAMNCTLEDAANLALAGTGWTVSTEITKLRSVATMKATPLTILGKIRDAWMCEIKYDNKNKIVYFKNELGEDKGVYFTRSLNLRKVELTSDSYDYFTRIIPIGADGLRITDVNGGKKYVENYQYSSKVRTLIWEDSSYEDAMALLEDAEKKLEDLSKPKKSYSADVVDLAKQNPDYSVLSYSLGDTVLLLDERTGIKDKQRIVRLREYPRNPEKNSCELSNTTLTFEEQQERLQAAADAVENITRADGTVNGVYVHGVEADGIVGIETVIGDSESVKNLNTQMSEVQSGLSIVNGELTIASAKIGTLETTALTATTADLRYATIERADILEGYVHNLEADYGDFKTLTADEFSAYRAEIDNLEADMITTDNLEAKIADIGYLSADEIEAKYAKIETLEAEKARIDTLVATSITTDNLQSRIAEIGYLSANEIDARYAHIDLSNIELGCITTAMLGTAVVGTTQIADGSITDAKIVELTANKITAGTLSVERLEIRGSENSIVYALNNITGALQAQNVNTLNGEILTERSITADKIVANSITGNEIAAQTILANHIDVTDLFAQDITATGTIRGVKLEGAHGSFSGTLSLDDEMGHRISIDSNCNIALYDRTGTDSTSNLIQLIKYKNNEVYYRVTLCPWALDISCINEPLVSIGQGHFGIYDSDTAKILTMYTESSLGFYDYSTGEMSATLVLNPGSSISIDGSHNEYDSVRFQLTNSLRTGELWIDANGRLGIYDATNSKWLIYSDTVGTQVNTPGNFGVGGIIYESGTALSSKYLALAGGTMSGTIHSSKVTSTYWNGNSGHALINSTASAGSYVMLAKLNSTNGYFTLGVYNGNYFLNYTAKSTVDAASNSVTKQTKLMDESGDASFANKVTAANEFVSTYPNGLRIAYGNYGFFIRNDGSNTYFMLTNSGEATTGTWNSLRPFTITNSNGAVSIDNGLYVKSGLSIRKTDTIIPIIYMGGASETSTERQVRFQVTSGTYPHDAQLYGGNSSSTTAIGVWDSKNSRGVWYYTDTDKWLYIPTAGTSFTNGVYFNGYAYIDASARIKGTLTMNGRISTVHGSYTSTVSNRFSSSALEIRENGLVGAAQSDIGYAPTIAFHWSGRIAGTLAFDTNGRFQFINQSGSNAPIGVSQVYVWNSGTTESQVRVQNGGADGLFCASATYKLGIYNNKAGAWSIYAQTNNAVFIADKAVVPPDGDTAIRGNGNGTHDCGHSSYRWKTIYSVNGLNTSSDEREKNILDLDLTDLSDYFMSLKPIAYRWNYGKDSRIHLGLGAQTSARNMLERGYDPYLFDMIHHDVLEEVSENGFTDRYSMNYQEIQMLTMMQTQKTTRDVIALKKWQITTDIEIAVITQKQDTQEARIRDLEQQVAILVLENERLKAALAA